jgi:hypothetical protein
VPLERGLHPDGRDEDHGEPHGGEDAWETWKRLDRAKPKPIVAAEGDGCDQREDVAAAEQDVAFSSGGTRQPTEVAGAPRARREKRESEGHQAETLEMEVALRHELHAPQWDHGLTSWGLACHRDNGRVNN